MKQSLVWNSYPHNYMHGGHAVLSYGLYQVYVSLCLRHDDRSKGAIDRSHWKVRAMLVLKGVTEQGEL